MGTSRLFELTESDPIPADLVSLRAFEKWSARGRRLDSSLMDWLEAEAEVRQLQSMNHKLQRLQRVHSDQLAASRRVQRHLAAEHDVCRILSISGTFEEAAPQILQALCRRLGFGVGAMWIFDHQVDLLRCEEVYHAPDFEGSAFVETTRARELTAGTGLPGRVWAARAPIAISDVAADRTLPRSASAEATGLHGAVAFPVCIGNEFIGVLEFYGSGIRGVDERLVETMSSIGAQISQFVERREAEARSLRENEDRQLAGRIQQRLLPRRMPEMAGYDIGGRCVSAFDVGGDCFDFVPMTGAEDECLGVLVADACGHGFGAALLVAETRASVRALAITCADPALLLRYVNRRLTMDSSDLERGGFVTALLLRLTAGGGMVVYANAGHCPAVVFDGKGNERGRLSSTELPLGIDPAGNLCKASQTVLKPNDFILLYSDGALDVQSPDGERFGSPRLLDVVRSHRQASAAGIVESVFLAIDRFRGNCPLLDDTTVVILKKTA